MGKSLRVRSKLMGRTKESNGSGALTPPAGADGALQYNNGGVFGGFGTWDDILNQFVLPGDLLIDGFKEMILRQSAAQPHRKFEVLPDWGAGLGPYVGQSGNIDRNIFFSDTIQDAIVTVLIFAQGVKQNGAVGSMGYSGLIAASFRKDGAADPVQIGANTVIFAKEDSADAPSVTISTGNPGDDNLRISYETDNVSDIYTWTFMGLIAWTKV